MGLFFWMTWREEIRDELTLPTLSQTPTSYEKELEQRIKTERSQLIQLLKALGDPTFKFFNGQKKANVARTKFVITGNSIPTELTKDDSALMSRWFLHNVEYPDEEIRKIIVDGKFLEFIKANKITLSAEQSKECSAKLKDILAYDAAKFRSYDRALGVRGLLFLIGKLNEKIQKNILDDPQASVCDDFDVVAVANSIKDYDKPENFTLKHQKLTEQVNTYLYENRDKIQAMTKQGCLNDAFRVKALDRDSSFSVRKKAFENFQTELAMNSSYSSIPIGEKFRKRFIEKFGFLFDDNSPKDSYYRSMSTVATEINRKIREAKNNKFLLVVREPINGTSEVVESLADFFEAPIMEIGNIKGALQEPILSKDELKIAWSQLILWTNSSWENSTNRSQGFTVFTPNSEEDAIRLVSALDGKGKGGFCAKGSELEQSVDRMTFVVILPKQMRSTSALKFNRSNAMELESKPLSARGRKEFARKYLEDLLESLSKKIGLAEKLNYASLDQYTQELFNAIIDLDQIEFQENKTISLDPLKFGISNLVSDIESKKLDENELLSAPFSLQQMMQKIRERYDEQKPKPKVETQPESEKGNQLGNKDIPTGPQSAE